MPDKVSQSVNSGTPAKSSVVLLGPLAGLFFALTGDQLWVHQPVYSRTDGLWELSKGLSSFMRKA